jgi:hypothetical protein
MAQFLLTHEELLPPGRNNSAYVTIYSLSIKPKKWNPKIYWDYAIRSINHFTLDDEERKAKFASPLSNAVRYLDELKTLQMDILRLENNNLKKIIKSMMEPTDRETNTGLEIADIMQAVQGLEDDASNFESLDDRFDKM